MAANFDDLGLISGAHLRAINRTVPTVVRLIALEEQSLSDDATWARQCAYGRL